MADWSMEVPAAEWTPVELQLAHWTTEPAAYALGIPTMEYASSTGIFGSSCYQTSITVCDEEQQCGYEVATLTYPNQAAQQGSVIHFQDTEVEDPLQEFYKLSEKCKEDAKGTNLRMHRYPAIIQALCLNERLTAPKVVAIGPYYHKCGRLQQAQEMKFLAVYNCATQATCGDVEPLYENFVSVADYVRSRYDQQHYVVAGMSCQDFRDMMFIDACFLVQYMFLRADCHHSITVMDQPLVAFFDTNDNDIFHDIMLLENQIPWPVVQNIIDSMDMDDARENVLLGKFIYHYKDCLRDLKRKDEEGKQVELYHICNKYEPPHLLGLLRYYIVGRTNTEPKALKLEYTISFSTGAIELSQIGIKLNANKNCTKLVDMGVQISCIVGCSELFLAPVTLGDVRASCLISMAAHELCIHPNFLDAKDEDSAVCSYLLLLAMLVAREEDVQKLREKHVLLGGGLVDKDVVDFVAKLHDLRLGTCYVRVMKRIADYQRERWLIVWAYSFWYKHRKTIFKVLGFILGSGGLTTLIQKLLWRLSPTMQF